MGEENKQIDKKWRNYWEKERVYSFKPDSKKKIYSIDTPPPTVSGEMHMGHAFMYSQMDFIARYKRMQGFNVFYPFGTDDNGLPTEKLIEKTNNVKSKSMPREEFIKLCLKTLKQMLPKFTDDWKNIGISSDFTKIYSTIDNSSRKISQKSFIELYNKGHIYKKEFPTIWDTQFQTPVAQAELEDKEKESFFTTIKFQCGEKILPIATTRPELLGACLAVFVNPKDKRYSNLIGKKAKIPLFNNKVPIIADDSADMKKGTGLLMVCSYGDKYDIQAVKKHKLNPRIIISKGGTINIAPYAGLTIAEARKRTLEDLKKNDLIINQEKIKHTVNVYEKSGAEIEFIPTEQWFIKILDKQKKLILLGKKIKWIPEYMFKRYENWILGLEWDWSISRERHFGVPIPLWYCKTCNNIILAKESELPVDPVEKEKRCDKCKSLAEPETKVLDTWATSSLSPKIASELFGGEIKTPYSLRSQGHDIIRTWAFYTIVKSYLHENKIPWNDIIITGNVKLKGEKMSKSKGNVMRPQEVLEKHGADAIRYWAASSTLGEDFEYHEKDVITGNKFSTKMLNAANFVFMNLEHQNKTPKILELDRIFLSQLNSLIAISTESFENYNYACSKLETDKFFWHSFADNYLEIVKNRVYNGTKEEKSSAFYTLYNALLTILKLTAPITPFITEEIYQQHFKKYEKEKSIHLTNWPEKIRIKESKDDDKKWARITEIIASVRQAKSNAKKSMKAQVILALPKEDINFLEDVLDDIKAVTCSKEINEGMFNIEIL